MQLKVIVDYPEIFIAIDQENDWLYVDWKGEHNQESSQAACTLMLESLRASQSQKVLNDNSNITRTTMQLTNWGAWWLEQMRLVGLQYIAWVMPPNLLDRQAVESVVHAIDTPRVGTFDDVASAYVWLQQQQVAVNS